MAEPSSVSKYVSEAVGTFALVLAVGCNVLMPSAFGVIAIASTLMVFIYSLGGISGGHFNPAVTLAVTLTKSDFGWTNMLIYWACQCVGGLLAACVYAANFGHVFNLHPAQNYNWFDTMIVEFVYTFMLVFVVLNVAVAARSQNNEYYGLAIAFTVVAGGYGAGKISGGAFNPAIALSVDLISAGIGFGYCGLYILAELLAGCFAHLMFRVVRPEEFGGSTEVGLFQKLVSEFIGTFFLIYTIGLNVASNVPAAAGVSIAASLMCMIYALGNVSGGHFNPAVTLAILVAGRNKIDAKEAACYAVTQLMGGICAGLAFGATVGGVPITQPSGGATWINVFCAELLFTFVLTFTVLCVATTRNALAHFFALAIGFCVVIGAYSIGGVSGGHMNPAVSFGLDVSGVTFSGAKFWKCCLYTVFQCCGGVLAAGVFAVTHATEYAKSKDYSIHRV